MLYLKLSRKIRYFQSHDLCFRKSDRAGDFTLCCLINRMTYSGYTLYRTRKTAYSFRLVRKSESTLKSPKHGVILSGYTEEKRHAALWNCAKFGVVTEVAVKMISFWDVTPYSMVDCV